MVGCKAAKNARTIALSGISQQQITPIQIGQILYRLKEILQGGLNMSYSKMDIINMIIRHTQSLRRSLSGEPSAATLAAWRLEDERNELVQDYYASQEEDDDEFTFDFTSEVKK